MAELNVQLHLLSKNKFKVEESPVEILVSMGFLCVSLFCVTVTFGVVDMMWVILWISGAPHWI